MFFLAMVLVVPGSRGQSRIKNYFSRAFHKGTRTKSKHHHDNFYVVVNFWKRKDQRRQFRHIWIIVTVKSGSQRTFGIPWRSHFRGRFRWRGSLMINCDFSDYRENREINISREPKLQTCSNLYSPLHWWQGWVSEQEDLLGWRGKTGKILFLENQSFNLVPTCIALSIGGRTENNIILTYV